MCVIIWIVCVFPAPPGPPTGIHAVIVSPWELSIEWEVPSTPTSPVYIVTWGETPTNLNNVSDLHNGLCSHSILL